MNEKKSNTEKAVDEINNFREAMRKATENSDDVKDGISTVEEEQQEPEFVLFDAIAESSINTLQMDAVVESMNKIADKLGDDLTSELCTIMAVLMSNSAFNAIMFYDDLLREQINEKFKEYDSIINDISAVTNGMNGAMEVFKKRIGDIQDKLGLDNAKK